MKHTSIVQMSLGIILTIIACKKETNPQNHLTPQLKWQTGIPAKSLGLIWEQDDLQLRTAGDKVLVFAGDTLIAYDKNNGGISWQRVYPDAESTFNPPFIRLIAETNILIFNNNQLECINAASGQVQWTRPQIAYEFPTWNSTPLGTLVGTSEFRSLDSTQLQLLDLATGQTRILRTIPHPPYTAVRQLSLARTSGGDTLIAAIIGTRTSNPSVETLQLAGIPVNEDKPVFQAELGLCPNVWPCITMEQNGDFIFIDYMDTLRAWSSNGSLLWTKQDICLRDQRYAPVAYDNRRYVLDNTLFTVESVPIPNYFPPTIFELVPESGAEVKTYESEYRPASDNYWNNIIYGAEAAGVKDGTPQEFYDGKLSAYNTGTGEINWDFPLPDSLWRQVLISPQNYVWVLVDGQAGQVYVLTDKYLQCYALIQ